MKNNKSKPTVKEPMFHKISKAQAKQRFHNNQAVYLCPRKLRPGFPFNPAALILSGNEYREKAEGYQNHPTLWKGNQEDTAWELMYQNWCYYNASYETGYYPHYYVESL